MQAIIDGSLPTRASAGSRRPTSPSTATLCSTTVLAWLAPTIDATGAEVSVGELPVVLAEKDAAQPGLPQPALQRAQVRRAGHPAEASPSRPNEPATRGVFSVTDNGIGIDAKYRERIFGMFKRLHSREDYPGTGIGLALVKKIVERHGGSVGVEDAPLGGSRFWFTLGTPDESATVTT